MANASIEEEEKGRKPKIGNFRLFTMAIQSIQRNKTKEDNERKQFHDQYKRDQCSEDSSSSKNTSNEFVTDDIKQHTSSQENSFLTNDNSPYNNHIKKTSNSWQDDDQVTDKPNYNVQTSKSSRSSSNSNYNYHSIRHDNYNKKSFDTSKDRIMQMPKPKISHNISHNSFDHNKENPSSNFSNSVSHISNSVQSVDQDVDKQDYNVQTSRNSRLYNNSSEYCNVKYNNHIKKSCDSSDNYIVPKSSRTNNISRNSCKYNKEKLVSENSNSDSCITNSKWPVSGNFPSNSSSSNFEKYSFHQSEKRHSYNHTKSNDLHLSENHVIYKESQNRNHSQFNSVTYSKKEKIKDKSNDILHQNIKRRDSIEDFSSDDNLNFKNHLKDDTEIKHVRVCSIDETIEGKHSLKITVHKSVPDSVPNASVSQVKSVSTPSISSTTVSPKLNTSPVFSASNTSSISVFPQEIISNPSLSNWFEEESLISNDSFIPPPQLSSTSDEIGSTVEKNETIQQNSESDSTDTFPYEDEASFCHLDPKHLEAISNFISKIVKENSVSTSSADKVVNDLHRALKKHIEGSVIDYYGSYDTDLAITTSGINLNIKTDVPMKKSFLYEIYKILSDDGNFHVHTYDEDPSVFKIKINFTHKDTGVSCELSYLGKYEGNISKMGKFLKAMCRVDHRQRVKHLIIAVKVWAEHLHINEIEDGKLSPIGFTLLVIHFLQHCENPILPIYCEKQDMKDLTQDLPCNDSSIGELWFYFLWYYTFEFDWLEDIVTVTSEDRVSKKSKKWDHYWIAIEDPFTGKNVAEKVIHKDVAEYIKSCFKQTYNYFLNGGETNDFSDEEENHSIHNSSSSCIKYSFNDCMNNENAYVCEMCEEIGDDCEECKKKIYVPPMASAPKMTDDFLKIIKKALSTVYDKYILSDEEISEREQFVKYVEGIVQRRYRDARMSLFGSSANGFGFKRSDLDICLTFESKKEHNPKYVLKDLRCLLQKNKSFANVIAIFNAQIPILKFLYKPKEWHGDISLNNTLAAHNSKLLYTYSLIDKRCKILGCALKLIAKKALIADVTEKALSSYSYLIMVIHFLQQTDPPILPVLQDYQFRDKFELHDIVENYNAWFCKDLDKINERFKSVNNTPVEQLFLDLLDYYCSLDPNTVITICQKEILSLSSCEKMRKARLFNIQDPFIIDKNLGSVVSEAKARETKNIFNKARMLFRTPKKELPTDLESYFFSTMNLTGRIQKEVLCNFCGKFGHTEKDCKHSFPLRNNFFKKFPSRKQYVNQNNTFKTGQYTRQCFSKKY